jgi:hypothetical protein
MANWVETCSVCVYIYNEEKKRRDWKIDGKRIPKDRSGCIKNKQGRRRDPEDDIHVSSTQKRRKINMRRQRKYFAEVDEETSQPIKRVSKYLKKENSTILGFTCRRNLS